MELLESFQSLSWRQTAHKTDKLICRVVPGFQFCQLNFPQCVHRISMHLSQKHSIQVSQLSLVQLSSQFYSKWVPTKQGKQMMVTQLFISHFFLFNQFQFLLLGNRSSTWLKHLPWFLLRKWIQLNLQFRFQYLLAAGHYNFTVIGQLLNQGTKVLLVAKLVYVIQDEEELFAWFSHYFHGAF